MNEALSRRTSVAAVLSMVFGILTWFALPLVGAVIAVICGHVARAEIRNSGGSIDGDGLAVAGLVLGWLNLGFALLIVLLVFGVIGVTIGSVGLGGLLHHLQDLRGCGIAT
ncbi:MAG: DUF4190 domain-containing protein [Gammaproteobacteria bacterium]|nr:DUF4190 domain-containing protein [Gammaproteobacteria bacterium]